MSTPEQIVANLETLRTSLNNWTGDPGTSFDNAINTIEAQVLPPSGSMTLAGTYQGVDFNVRRIDALIHGVVVGSQTLQPHEDAFSFTASGGAGQAVEFAVNDTVMGITLPGGATCLAFVASGVQTGITVIQNGTPDTSCGS